MGVWPSRTVAPLLLSFGTARRQDKPPSECSVMAPDTLLFAASITWTLALAIILLGLIVC
jgi:hypothetical protein